MFGYQDYISPPVWEELCSIFSAPPYYVVVGFPTLVSSYFWANADLLHLLTSHTPATVQIHCSIIHICLCCPSCLIILSVFTFYFPCIFLFTLVSQVPTPNSAISMYKCRCLRVPSSYIYFCAQISIFSWMNIASMHQILYT